jgi:hypothetical protein
MTVSSFRLSRTRDELILPIVIATVRVSKGALVSVSVCDGRTYVRSCGELGTVIVNVEGRALPVNCGEEILVTDHTPITSEMNPSDGIGRRNSKVACTTPDTS